MVRNWLFTSALLIGVTGVLGAQPFPPSPQPPFPAPNPVPSQVTGQWFFRGDPRQPCFIQAIGTPQGTMLVFTNEKGSQAYGRLSWGGRKVIVYDWNLTGYLQGNSIIWPNGDFWSR
jgi:hypothetical protein